MHKVPSIDLASVHIPDDAGPRDAMRRLREFTTKELKDELLERDCVDFSKWNVHLKLAPFYLFLVLLITMQARTWMDGTILACLLP